MRVIYQRTLLTTSRYICETGSGHKAIHIVFEIKVRKLIVMHVDKQHTVQQISESIVLQTIINFNSKHLQSFQFQY
jgi:hypothetical protein